MPHPIESVPHSHTVSLMVMINQLPLPPIYACPSRAQLYPAGERESSYCVQWKKFHSYLFGHFFIILSNHKPLRYLFKSDSATPILTSACLRHWTLLLSSIEYRPGEHHTNADFLSPYATTRMSNKHPHNTRNSYLWYLWTHPPSQQLK